jgi:uncharacterized protein YbjQ (UPF0145 family)
MEIIPGKHIKEHLGLVQGSTVRTKHVGRDIMASLKNTSAKRIFFFDFRCFCCSHFRYRHSHRID